MQMTMSWRSDGLDESTTAASHGLASTGPIMVKGTVDDSHEQQQQQRFPPPDQACETTATTTTSSSVVSSPIGGDDETTTTATTATAATTIMAANADETTTTTTSSAHVGLMTRDQPASSSIDDDQQQQQQDMLTGGNVSLTTTTTTTTKTDVDAVDPPYKSSLSSPSTQQHQQQQHRRQQQQQQRQAIQSSSSNDDGDVDDDDDDDYLTYDDDYDDDDDDDEDGDDGADHTLSQRPQELHQGQQSLNASTTNRNNNNNNSSNSSSNNNKTSSSSSSKQPLRDGSLIPEDDTEGVDQEIPWKPQDTQSVCEFTHTITEYSSKRDSGCKKAEYSATTIDNLGNKWRLIVYVNGNGRASNHHLSLFLQVADADDLPFGWKKAVSYVLTLEHPTGASLSYAKRNPDKTFKLCPKAIDWGWSQFITSDRIQQEGFVQNDSLVVRASVTVKSSSVNIDIEDAELYLKCAVEEGKPDAVQLCLDQGATVNCQFKDDLYTPLHTACSATPAASDDSDGGDNSKSAGNVQGSMQVLQLLLEKGADGNACNKWRETPLLIAANNGHRAAVEALLDHDADPSLCSEAGWSALTFAAHKGYDDIVALLLEKGAPVNCLVTEDASTPLHKACAGSKPGHLRAVKLLLKSGADVHALNKWRETPLLTAANHGQAGAVEALLKAGADPCKCTDTGWSPLSIAAYKGHDDVVKLLLEEGAPTEEADPTLSALLQAATKGLPDTVGLLLRHGADHTVTTKKGDTALSILVEQNLIDAAVEMVTEYKASVPRCSRDRKKVQRARLLINLRLKQQQRDDLNLGTDDDDDDESVSDDTPAAVSVVDDTESVRRQGKKKSKKKKVSAEQQAKEAEEALLLELEQEDAERHKQEEEANKKSAKKKKKKERERQQKKEVEERRLEEERILEESRRKEREAKEAAERAEKERIAALKKKEEDEIRERQEQAKQQQQQKELELRKKLEKREDDRKASQQSKVVEQNSKNGQHTPVGQAKVNKNVKGAPRVPKNQQSSSRSATPNVPVAGAMAETKAVSTPATSSVERNPPGKRRGWESLPGAGPGQKPARDSPAAYESNRDQLSTTSLSNDPVSLSSQPHTSERSMTETALVDNTPRSQQSSSSTVPMAKPIENVNASQSSYGPAATAMFKDTSKDELPSVALFRLEKVSELLQRCSVARASSEPLGFVNSTMLRKVLSRWIMRAAHESSEYVDFIIPSWIDFEKLATFFHRQLISETRKEGRDGTSGTNMLSMEALKEAGTSLAILCHSLAREVALFRRRVEEPLPVGWNDSSIGMTVAEIAGNSSESTIVINWAGQSQVTFPRSLFTQLRGRYQGEQSRLLASMFTAKISYSTRDLLIGNSGMGLHLLPATRSMLSVGLSVTAEVWSSPFTVLGRNHFWGLFAEIDTKFGGFKPFGTYDRNDDILMRDGGSVSVLVPPDSMLASGYVRRIIDLLEYGEQARVPLSFAVFLRSECLVDPKPSPSVDDFLTLDPRLREREILICKIGRLPKGKHFYYDENQRMDRPSATDSLFMLLQNWAGREKYAVDDTTILAILQSTDSSTIQPVSNSTFGGSLGYSAEPTFPSNDSTFLPDEPYGRNVHPLSSSPVPSYPPVASDFGPFGNAPTSAMANPFASANPSPGSQRRAPPRRGRLFDLVDDGDEDATNDVDVVSGMLGTLNVDDLFQSSGVQDVDIEAVAISLMDIGGSSGPNNGLNSRRTHGRFG